MVKNLKGFCFAILGLGCAMPLAAQQRQMAASKAEIQSNQAGSVHFEKFSETELPLVTDLQGLLKERYGLGGQVELRLQREITDGLGNLHKTYQQFQDGWPVEGAIVKVHCRDGHVTGIHGRFIPGVQSTSPVLTEAQALQLAIEKTAAAQLIWDDAGQELLLQRITGNVEASWKPKGALCYVMNGLSKTATYRLAWKLDVYSLQPLFRADIYIDAENGDLIFRNERLTTADANGVGHTAYSGVQNIVTDSLDPNTFRLQETGRALGVETYNMLNGTDYNAAVDFLDSNNVWDDTLNLMQSSALDAHWGAEMTYDYYSHYHGRDSYDDASSKLISFVHYDNNYANAFWNGIFMTYGDGGSNSNPFQGLDVCGHEFTHGVTEYSAGLVYQDEPGALNESFSDIFGNTIEFWARPNDASWRIGDDIGAFRSMQDPQGYLNPDTYKGTFWAVGTWDNGGVHTNSGVQNHWYYLLSDGGSGTNDNGDAYSVTGIGIDSAAAIAYRNLSVYLTANDGYAEARRYSIEAAIDLFGECSPQMIQTIKAWHAVGVGLPYTGTLAADFYSPDTNQCDVPVEVEFFNHSTSALYYHWDFGDGQTSTAENPTHTYTAVGNYTVTLIAIGCNGQADTLVMPNRININLDQPCNVNIPATGDSLLLTACEGNLYDSGGSDDYLNNSGGRVTIEPGGGNQVLLVFSIFDFAAGDRLTIYDGPNTQSPLIGVYVGATLPPAITSTNGALTLKESTNGANTRDGFVATWSCITAVANGLDAGCQVFPNPTSGLTQVRWNNVDGTENEIVVVDALGRAVKRIAGTHRQDWETQIDLSQFPAGIYTLHLRAGTARRIQKIIVQ